MKIKIKIKNEKKDSVKFDKYVSPLINYANRTAQSTRPKIVGQLSDLFPEFIEYAINSDIEISVSEWEKWYNEKNSNAINDATEKTNDLIEKLKEVINQIDRDTIYNWEKDLIIDKTFNGLSIQKIILAEIAKQKGVDYRLSTPEEEKKGIDGYVGDTPYSIKPSSYKNMDSLNETIDVKIIVYKETNDGIEFELDD